MNFSIPWSSVPSAVVVVEALGYHGYSLIGLQVFLPASTPWLAISVHLYKLLKTNQLVILSWIG